MKKELTILLTCCLVIVPILKANETIKFTWQGDKYGKGFYLIATKGKQFTIDWGDGSAIETKTGEAISQTIRHAYANAGIYTVVITAIEPDCFFTAFDCSSSLVGFINEITNVDLHDSKSLLFLNCSSNLLKSINLSECKALEILDLTSNILSVLDLKNNFALQQLYCSNNFLTSLDVCSNTELNIFNFRDNDLKKIDLTKNLRLKQLICSNNKINSLDLDNHVELFYLHCVNNSLHLSNLYQFSQKISNQTNKCFGSQTLVKQTITVGETVDFSEQKEFGYISTIFTIEKNGLPASPRDYVENKGIIKFNLMGNYTVTMTNSAIVSNCPAKVTVNIDVLDKNVSIPDCTISDADFIIYPNPAFNKVYIKTAKTESPEVKLYSANGNFLIHTFGTEIDLPPNAVGLFFLEVNGKVSKIILQ